MESKLTVHIEVDKEGRKYTFIMPVGAKWGESYDACFECLMNIVEMSKSAAQNMEQQPVEAPAKEA